MWWGLPPAFCFTPSFVSKGFFYTLETPIFQEHQWTFAIHCFPLTSMCQTRIYLFVSLFLQKIWLPILVSYKLELRICLILVDVALKFSPAFQNKEAAFKRCFTKEVVQQNEVIKYNSPGQVVKGRKALHANLLKIALWHKYFSKNLSTSSGQFKTHLDGYFIGQLFFENVPKWLFLKYSC